VGDVPFRPDDVARLVEAAERQVQKLREIRRELELQREVLERMLARLESIERTQFS
jgi:uncharacterized protein involved in exopolysaccharide biosynthesis